MKKPISMGRRLNNAVTVAFVAFAFVFSGVPQSFASCGGYCSARQVRAICHHAVASKDLKADKRDAEFEKCAADPLGYRIQTAEGRAQFGLD
jgi:hypothetical protein